MNDLAGVDLQNSPTPVFSELVEKELASGLKSKDNKEVIVDVTKKVLVKLYRELAYNYTPVIDRIKI